MALDRTFNVVEDCQRFQEYIRELREGLRDPSRAPPLENHPNLHLLRPTTRREPRQWLHLRMVADNSEIIVWIRTDNLYVVGFEQAQGGRRYEFGTDPRNDAKKRKDEDKKARKKKGKEDEAAGQQRQPLIPGATFLGFGGGYTDLGELLAGPDGTTRRAEPDLGWQPLRVAIQSLAAYTPEAPGAVRNWLRTIVVTVSESLRLHNVCEFMDGLLRGYASDWLTRRLIDCIHNWGAISACVIASAADPDGDAHGRYSLLSENGICRNTDQACKLVAILNTGAADDDKDKPGPSHRRPKREAGLYDDQDVPQAVAARGLNFVEVFSAVVQGSTGRNNLYGHIAIIDDIGSGSRSSSQVLFHRGRPNAAVLPSADDGHRVINLTGPARAVWCYGEVVMRVDLLDAIPGAVADMTPDSDEIGSGKLVWNTYDTPRMVYDEVEEYVFEGASGGAAVNVRCAVVTNAVVATVVLWHTGRRGPKDVYGTVSAATDRFGPEDKVTLFDREWKDAVSVEAGDNVPLLRKVAVVPLRSSLMICANLWSRAYVTDMSADDRISSGAVAVFQAGPFVGVWKVIGHSDFEVGVTWSLN